VIHDAELVEGECMRWRWVQVQQHGRG
jgi:hypothetical protein